MAAVPRTTPELVAGIIQVDPAVDLTPFITAANLLTTSVCGAAKPPYDDSGVDSLMEVIERWLAAHFYALYDQQLATAKAGTVAVAYQTKVGMGLAATTWGQMAMRFDNQGLLAAMDNAAATRKKVSVRVMWAGQRTYLPIVEILPALGN